jgi:hypothetical protein
MPGMGAAPAKPMGGMAGMAGMGGMAGMPGMAGTATPTAKLPIPTATGAAAKAGGMSMFRA